MRFNGIARWMQHLQYTKNAVTISTMAQMRKPRGEETRAADRPQDGHAEPTQTHPEARPRSRAPRRPSTGIDDLDRAVIDRLRHDGREGNRSLAAALGVGEVTIASRLKRLEESLVLRVVAVIDMEAFGHRDLVLVKIRVTGRPVTEVSEELAQLPEVIAVTITTGNFDIIVALLARDHRHLSTILAFEFPRRGIAVTRAELALEVFKYESKWAALTTEDSVARADLKPNEIADEADVSIIGSLQNDARRSNRNIAAELGVSEGTVRARIKRLQDDRIIRIQAVANAGSFGITSHAYVGINTEPSHVHDVAESLIVLNEITVLLRTLGQFDIVAVVQAESRAVLLDTVMNKLASTKGVTRTETFEAVATIKHSYEWGRII
jgi:DNA-binding Lrp family transcriptional regulator